MNSNLHSHRFRTGRRCVSRSVPFIAVFTLAAQVVAQSPSISEPAGAAVGSTQTMAAQAGHAQVEISAPAPAATQQEALLSSPDAVPFLAIEAAQDNGQSSSQSGQSATNSMKTTAASKKPPHRGLGIALAVLGVTALAAGAVAYGVGKTSLCVNEQSGGCKEARDAGIALMPIGGAVAVTGFYLQFHR
jgi:hypothetical protein